MSAHDTRLWHGYVLVPALTCLAELGLTERWRRGELVDLAEHCAEHGIRLEVAAPLADYLVTHGYLVRQEGGYRHVAGLPELEDAVAKWRLASLFASYAPVLAALPELARGASVESLARPVGQDGAPFLSALQSSTHQRVTGYLRASPVEHLVDAECGDGSFLLEVAEALPQVRLGGLAASAGSLERGRRRLEAAGHGARCQLAQRDWRSLADSAFDDRAEARSAITFFFCLHRTAFAARAEVVRALLRLARVPGLRLIVSEVMRPTAEDLARYHRSTGVAELVALQDLSGAGFLSLDGWTALLSDAGFRVSEVLTSVPRVQGALPTIGTLIAEPIEESP